MSLTKRVGLLGGVAVLTISGGSFADPAADATNQELRTRIAELEKRLAAVESQDGESWLTEQRAAEVRSLIQDTLADADTRSSLLAQGMTAGYDPDHGAVIASADGSFRLNTRLHMQTRFVLSSQDQSFGGGDNTTYGVEVTRTKFILDGHVVSPEWFYKVEIEVGSNNVTTAGDSRTGLGDAYVGYDYADSPFKIQIGTFKPALLREEMIDSRHQLAVERSVVNYLFTGGRTDGIRTTFTGDQLRIMGGINNGISDGLGGGGVVTGGTAATGSDTDFAFTARGEWLAMGNWDQFEDFTSTADSETGVLIGGAIHYQTAEDDVPGIADIDLLVLTLDTQIEFGGGNLFAALMYADYDATGPGLIDSSPIGIVVQGGYYFAEGWEGFGRYEWADLDNPAAQDVSILTVGVNKYFAGHNAKWTTDVGVAFDSIAVAVPVTGYRADAVGSDGQVVIRSQLQIVF